MQGGAMVALSGGQDSTTCLYWALARYDRVEAVSFDYGQRHRVELGCAQATAEKAGVPWTRLHIGDAFTGMGAASLTNAEIPSRLDADGTGNTVAAERGLPSSFVPGRNIILLGLAAALAITHGLDRLVSGVCEEDDAGYPDCRAAFIESLEDTIRQGTDTPGFHIVTPLMCRSKADTWALAHALGITDLIITDTHTCYNGDHSTLHPWGYGCGECPACQTRAAGYAKFAEGAAA